MLKIVIVIITFLCVLIVVLMTNGAQINRIYNFIFLFIVKVPFFAHFHSFVIDPSTQMVAVSCMYFVCISTWFVLLIYPEPDTSNDIRPHNFNTWRDWIAATEMNRHTQNREKSKIVIFYLNKMSFLLFVFLIKWIVCRQTATRFNVI